MLNIYHTYLVTVEIEYATGELSGDLFPVKIRSLNMQSALFSVLSAVQDNKKSIVLVWTKGVKEINDETELEVNKPYWIVSLEK